MTRPPLAAPIASLLIASLTLQPMLVFAQAPGTSGVADRALQRVQQRVQEAIEDTRKGEAALDKKDYEAAFAHFDNACNKIPAGAPAAKAERARAVDGLTIAGRRLAEQRVTEGYYASAVQVLQEVLRHNPNDKATLRLISNIEAPDYFPKQMTPQHRARVEEVKQDFIAAEGYKKLGRNNLALTKAEQILNLDGDNIAANKLRGEVYEVKNRAAEAAYDATRSQAIWETTKE